MKLLTDTWRQLMQRRLWPVALLLLGALVAVPFVLGKSPEPVAPSPVPAAAGAAKATAANADPIVAMVSEEDRAETRRALGSRHNPFASSAPKTKAKKPKSEPAQDTPPSSEDPGGSAPANGGGSAPETPTAPKPEMETIPAKSIDVRFGPSDSDENPRTTLRVGEALPDKDEPALVFVGLKDGGKTAAFMLADGLRATGDGKCVPADTCETIELRVGETEFFEMAGDPDSTEFELDLVKIYAHQTKVPVSSDSTGLSSGTSAPSAGAASAKAERR